MECTQVQVDPSSFWQNKSLPDDALLHQTYLLNAKSGSIWSITICTHFFYDSWNWSFFMYLSTYVQFSIIFNQSNPAPQGMIWKYLLTRCFKFVPSFPINHHDHFQMPIGYSLTWTAPLWPAKHWFFHYFARSFLLKTKWIFYHPKS